MPASTDNLNLTLPATTEDYSINDFNTNFTKIDDFAGTVTAAISDTSIIADNTISGSSTYSSSKINTIVGQAQSTANQALQTANQAVSDIDAVDAALNDLADGVADASAIRATAISGSKIATAGITTRTLASSAVTEVKIKDGAITLTKLASELTNYTTTPQKIGTWIDGVPIWRVAIYQTLDNTAFQRGYYELNSIDDLKVYDRGDIRIIINSYLRAYYPNNDAEDSDPAWIGDMFRAMLTDVESSYSLLRGYIEFVTPATNIRA